MSDYNEQTLMEAVITRVAGAPDPRLRQIMTSLVYCRPSYVLLKLWPVAASFAALPVNRSKRRTIWSQ